MRPAPPATVLLVALIVLAAGIAAAAATASFVATLVSDNGLPVPGASVTLRSASNTYAATSDASGRVSIGSVVADTYTVVVAVPGFDTLTVAGITVAPDASQTVSLTVKRATRSATPRPTPSPPPTAADAGPAVEDSILAIVNASNPEHGAGRVYFGRYSYVLLRDDATAAEKNRAVLARLADKYLRTGAAGAVSAGAPGGIDQPAAYNLFLVLVKDGVQTLPAETRTQLVDGLLKHYDYDKARNVRDAYCAVAAHKAWGPCAPPRDTGPLIVTFLRPLGGGGAYPPALAYDFSSVPVTQVSNAVDAIQAKIAVADAVAADQMLPPSAVAKYVAPGLTLLADALNASIAGVRTLLDDALKKR